MLVQSHLVGALLCHHIYLVQHAAIGRKVDLAHIDRAFYAVKVDALVYRDKAHILEFKLITTFFEFHSEVSCRVSDATRHKSLIWQRAGAHSGIFHGMACGIVNNTTFHSNGGIGIRETEQKCQYNKKLSFHVRDLFARFRKCKNSVFWANLGWICWIKLWTAIDCHSMTVLHPPYIGSTST